MAGLRRKHQNRVGSINSLEDFLAHLLALESGIDPTLFEWYLWNYETPVIDYPQVSHPGRVLREKTTGEFLVAKMSVRQYFETLGVAEIFDPDSSASVKTMQYRATNVLGFVGYQIGEAILIETGHYEPVTIRRSGLHREYPSYYLGNLSNMTWRESQQTLMCRTESGVEIVATDTNLWQGRFTGKDGVCSLQDLYCGHLQEKVIRDIVKHQCRAIASYLSMKGIDAERLIAQHKHRNDREGETLNFEYTPSGLVAAAHLCGALATVDFLLTGTLIKDEFGTPVSCYLREFSGYEIPFF